MEPELLDCLFRWNNAGIFHRFKSCIEKEPFTVERTEIASSLISLFANKQAVSILGDIGPG
jgi:hypothetical protein